MIRKATYEDLPALMEIFRNARGIMRSSGNLHQWNDGYPSEEIVRQDIDAGHSQNLATMLPELCWTGRLNRCLPSVSILIKIT